MANSAADARGNEAAIREKLIKEKYLVREGKELAPTGKAFELLSLLTAMKIDVLASPEMTGEWEYKLSQILKGSFTRSQFMKEILGDTVHRKYAELKLAQAERCPKALGARIKRSEVMYHHEVTNQYLWSKF